MFSIIAGLVVVIACSLPAFAQTAKGVDKQNERVRDSGSQRTPANNGNKTDVGAAAVSTSAADARLKAPPLPNPYRLTGRRDVIITAVQELMRDRKLVLDEAGRRSCRKESSSASRLRLRRAPSSRAVT